jgi:putative MFS transporter
MGRSGTLGIRINTSAALKERKKRDPPQQKIIAAIEMDPGSGKGAGFAAAFGKIGAVATGFFFPILLAGIGTTALLYILVVTSIR